MKVLKIIELGNGLSLVVKAGSSNAVRRIFVIAGVGQHAILDPTQGAALYGALRTLDSEGLLEDC